MQRGRGIPSQEFEGGAGRLLTAGNAVRNAISSHGAGAEEKTREAPGELDSAIELCPHADQELGHRPSVAKEAYVYRIARDAEQAAQRRVGGDDQLTVIVSEYFLLQRATEEDP